MLGEIRSENDQGLLFECLLVMAGAATMALMFSLLAGLNWQKYLMLMGAAAVLTGGILFSLIEMYRLGYPTGRLESARPVADSAVRMISRAQRRATAEERVDSNEACFHHENHPESPGEDQGQLVSHLSGTTPFFEDVD